MTQFGEIKFCTTQKNKSSFKNKWIIQFYDFRSAQKCVRMQNIQYKDEDLFICFSIKKTSNNHTKNLNDFYYNYKPIYYSRDDKKEEKLSRFNKPKKNCR